MFEENKSQLEKVLGKKKCGNTVKYLIKWKDFEEKHATWEPIEKLFSYLDRIEEFETNLMANQSKEKTEKEKKMTQKARKREFSHKNYSKQNLLKEEESKFLHKTKIDSEIENNTEKKEKCDKIESTSEEEGKFLFYERKLKLRHSNKNQASCFIRR